MMSLVSTPGPNVIYEAGMELQFLFCTEKNLEINQFKIEVIFKEKGGKKMIQLGNALILLALAFALFLAVIAIIRGYKGMKMSKSFDTSAKKIKVGYWLLSAIHMLVGILITLCYLIAGVLILNKL